MNKKERSGEIIAILDEWAPEWPEPIVSRIKRISSSPYLILISTLISLRTKDQVTADASERLFELADTPEAMLKLDKEHIEKLIYPAGFYHTKAQNILSCSQIIMDEYSGVVPDSLDELLKLPGVGRKTANLVITLGYNKAGICVDTHVHRISNRLGLVKTKNPEQTEFALMKVLDKSNWIRYNDLLVAFGQNHCKPISPYCSTCKLNKICPALGVGKHR